MSLKLAIVLCPSLLLVHIGHTASILDGKKISSQWQTDLLSRAAEVTSGLGRPPGLGVILVGSRPDSRIYVQRKQEACAKVCSREVACWCISHHHLHFFGHAGRHQGGASAACRHCFSSRCGISSQSHMRRPVYRWNSCSGRKSYVLSENMSCPQHAAVPSTVLCLQLPLPKHLDDQAVIHAVDPKKDVDGFHPHHRYARLYIQ